MKKGKHVPSFARQGKGIRQVKDREIRKLEHQVEGLEDELKKLTGQSKQLPVQKRHQSDLYPLYYDLYCDLYETKQYYHPSMGDIVPGTPAHDWYMDKALKEMRRSQVRVLDQPVVELLAQLMDKAGSTLAPYIPYPKYPLSKISHVDRI